MLAKVAIIIVGTAAVHDGDTIRIGNERIRVMGIDAPELRQTCQQGRRAVACGVQSRDRLVAIIAGRPVRCEGKSRDKYRRLVAVCRVAGVDVGRQMVLEGWAVAYRRYSMAYVAQEGRARTLRRGIWAMSFEQPGDWRKRR